MEEGSWVSLLSKYFLHGFLFSILFLFLDIAWTFLLVILVGVGLWIGLIVGVVLLFFLIGALNVFLIDNIWKFTVESNLTSLLVHGLALFVVLLVVAIPSIVINLYFPSLLTTVVLFIVYCFIDGFVAANIAGYWEQAEETEEIGESV